MPAERAGKPDKKETFSQMVSKDPAEMSDKELQKSLTVQEIKAVRAGGFEVEFENTQLDMVDSYGITMKQADMVRAFISTARFNMQEAMIQAGYSKGYAAQHHVDMLQHPKVVRAVKGELQKSNVMPGASRHWLQAELKKILELSTTEGDYGNALRAIEMLGRSIGELASNVSHRHEGNVRTESVSYMIVANKKIPI